MAKTAISLRFQREGFGLVELLVVIVVVALLVVFLVPVVFKSSSEHHPPKSMAFVHRVVRATDAFKGENNGMYPGQSEPELLTGSEPVGSCSNVSGT